MYIRMRPRLLILLMPQVPNLVTVATVFAWISTFIWQLRASGGETVNASAVVKGRVELPCDISPPAPDDKTLLVLWYKDGSGSPVHSLDLRGKQKEPASQFSPDDIRSRTVFSTEKSPATLLIQDIRDEDEGIYRCRVDFKKAPTRNNVVSLGVIVPPKEPTILGEKGLELSATVGPYNEGSSLFLSCEVVGGRPPPRVTWWRRKMMLDDSYEVTSLGIVRNDLVVPSLKRQDFNAIFTCQASNNNFTAPVTTSITVDMNLKPLDVKIINEPRPLSANKRYELTCQSTGSRPPPIMAWWKGNKRMKRTEETMSADSNITISVLSFTPTSEDHGKHLSCRAENPAIQSSGIEDGWNLDVQYAPVASLELGSSLRDDNIREGDDIYFECNIRSNPWVSKVEWKFENKPLLGNLSSGVIISNQSLVLQKVTRRNGGTYSCVGINSEGASESNRVSLQIKHIPFCKAGQKTSYGVARNEEVKITCEVEAYPPEVKFDWAFNHTTQPVNKSRSLIINDMTMSTLTYMPKIEKDYGIFYCWASNDMGVQLNPCIFTLVPAGPPDPAHNCTVFNQTETSLYVDCQSGYDGGLPQTFTCSIFDSTSQELRSTVTSAKPSFHITKLPSGSNFILSVFASNSKGQSDVYTLMASTIKAPEKESGSDGLFTTILGIVTGVVVALALLGITIIIIIRVRTSPRSKRKEYEPEQADRSHIPLRRDTDDAAENEEKSPDLIPNQEFPSVKVKCLEKWAYSKDGTCENCRHSAPNAFGGPQHDNINSYRYQIRKIIPFEEATPPPDMSPLKKDRHHHHSSPRWTGSQDASEPLQTYQGTQRAPPPERFNPQPPTEDDVTSAVTPLMDNHHESTV